MFEKGLKMPGEDGGWAKSYDGHGKWHQIDNHGTVRASLTQPALIPPARRSSSTWLPRFHWLFSLRIPMPHCMSARGAVCVCGVRVCCTNRREQLEARRVPVRPDRRGHAHVHHRPHHHLETTTYKESLNGPNISKAQAIANSEEWELTEPDVDPATALDAMPASNVDFAAEPATSASASDAGSSLGLARGHARQACPPRRVGCAGAASHCALSSLLSYASHDSCASPSRSRRAAKRHAQRDRCATCP